MRHDRLIGLPALSGDRLDQFAWLRSATEKQLEKLIDKSISRRQRVIGQDEAGDRLDQAALEPGADSVKAQAAEAMRKPDRALQSEHSAKGDAEHVGSLQSLPIKELDQIRGQVLDA